MNYLKKLGLILALAIILLPFAVTPADAQQNGRHGNHTMRSRQDDNGRRVRRNRNWSHQNRKYWQNSWKKKHKHKRHHTWHPIRRGNQ